MKFFTKEWYQNCQKTFAFLGFTISKKAKALTNDLEKQTQKALHDYQEHWKQIEPFLPNCIKDLNMHDCRVIGNYFEDKDFCMDIDSSDGFCSVKKIIFINAEILEHDIELDNAWWLYDEVYIKQDRYEMHILFHYFSEKLKLGEMIIGFDEISLESDVIKK